MVSPADTAALVDEVRELRSEHAELAGTVEKLEERVATLEENAP